MQIISHDINLMSMLIFDNAPASWSQPPPQYQASSRLPSAAAPRHAEASGGDISRCDLFWEERRAFSLAAADLYFHIYIEMGMSACGAIKYMKRRLGQLKIFLSKYYFRPSSLSRSENICIDMHDVYFPATQLNMKPAPAPNATLIYIFGTSFSIVIK